MTARSRRAWRSRGTASRRPTGRRWRARRTRPRSSSSARAWFSWTGARGPRALGSSTRRPGSGRAIRRSATARRYLRRGSRSGSARGATGRSEEHTSELQSHVNIVCRLLLEKKKNNIQKVWLDNDNNYLINNKNKHKKK